MVTLDMSEVKRYVQSSIGEIHSNHDVAEHFGITATALGHSWRRAGERLPLGKFIEEVRVRVSMSIHRTTPGASCKEIAYEAGYHSEDVASRSFKRITGQSMKRSLLSDHSDPD